MANSVLMHFFRSKLPLLHGFSWKALARMIPQLEVAGLSFFYRINPMLSFAAREIQAITEKKSGEFFLTLNFMGLQGIGTPLPIHYTEWVIQDDPDESSLNEFYNFFNRHFFTSMLLIQQKYAYLPQLQANHQDRLSLNILSFSGLHPTYFEHEADYLKMLPFSSLLLGGVSSRSNWCRLIKCYFGLTQVWLKFLAPKKVKIPFQYLNALGRNIHLGHSGSLGSLVIQAKTQVEVHLVLEEFTGFLPHQSQFQALKRLLVWMTPENVRFCMIFHIKKGNRCDFTNPNGLYLGWNTSLTHHLQPEITVSFN